MPSVGKYVPAAFGQGRQFSPGSCLKLVHDAEGGTCGSLVPLYSLSLHMYFAWVFAFDLY